MSPLVTLIWLGSLVLALAFLRFSRIGYGRARPAQPSDCPARRGGRVGTAQSVAHDTYFAADKAAGKLLVKEIPHAKTDAERATRLDELAFLAQLMADVHLTAFGPCPNADEDGRDGAESARLAFLLIRLVANTELTLAGMLKTDCEIETRRLLVDDLFGDNDSGQFAQLAGKLAATGDLVERYRLLRLMWHELYPVVGGQAAEALASLAAAYLRAAGWGRAQIDAEINDQLWTHDDPAEIASRDILLAKVVRGG